MLYIHLLKVGESVQQSYCISLFYSGLTWILKRIFEGITILLDLYHFTVFCML